MLYLPDYKARCFVFTFIWIMGSSYNHKWRRMQKKMWFNNSWPKGMWKLQNIESLAMQISSFLFVMQILNKHIMYAKKSYNCMVWRKYSISGTSKWVEKRHQTHYTVSRNIKKSVSQYGIQGIPRNFIRSYLTDRTQEV